MGTAVRTLMPEIPELATMFPMVDRRSGRIDGGQRGGGAVSTAGVCARGDGAGGAATAVSTDAGGGAGGSTMGASGLDLGRGSAHR